MAADTPLAETDPARRAEQMLGRAAKAGDRAAERLQRRIADFAGDPEAQLDDQLRAQLHHRIDASVQLIERQLREQASKLLVVAGDRAAGARVAQEPGSAALLLSRTRLLPAPALLQELIAQIRHDLISERLPHGAGERDEPSLLTRLTDVGDPEVARAARSLLVAESRRREALSLGPLTAVELTAELHQELVWLVAAALRCTDRAISDRVLNDAAGHVLLGFDEGERMDAAALRLARAIDARPGELGPLIDEALNDRRLSLVLAVLAHAAHLSFDQVRALVTEPDDDRWWLLLRSVDLDPLTVARIALALADADPRRRDQDIPEILDAVNAVPTEEARAVFDVLRLPAELRGAVQAVQQALAS